MDHCESILSVTALHTHCPSLIERNLKCLGSAFLLYSRQQASMSVTTLLHIRTSDIAVRGRSNSQIKTMPGKMPLEGSLMIQR